MSPQLRLPLACCAVVIAPSLGAQTFPTVDALELGFGVARPSAATGATTLGVAADLDLGHITRRELHVIVGFDAAESQSDDAIRVDGHALSGSYTMGGARVGLRWDILGPRAFTPFISAMVAGENVHSRTEVDRADQIMNRFSVGPVVGVGVTQVLDPEGHIFGSAQITRAFFGTTGHWRFGLALRFSIFDWRDRTGRDDVGP